MSSFTLAIVGDGRSGKDTAAEWFRDHTRLTYTAATSEILLPYVVARIHGIPIKDCTRENYPEIFNREWLARHQHRELWFETGILVRRDDPAFLVRRAVELGQDIVVGIRDQVEIQTAKREGLVDLVLWIDRDVPLDPTLTYGVEEADLVILNHWGVPEFHNRLRRFADAIGLNQEPPDLMYWSRSVEVNLPRNPRPVHPIQAARDHYSGGHGDYVA